MTDQMNGPAAAPTVPIADQIAAVKEALDNAVGIRANVVGKTTEFAALAELYDRRIAGLFAALTTLRTVKP
jgi:hypothetical protein